MKNSNRLLITQQEMVLIKNSKEVQNTEVYGNLFECIERYSKVYYKDLDEDEAFDNRAKAVILSPDNKKLMLENIMQEWYASREFETSDKIVNCQLCGTKNRYIFYVKNKATNMELHIGSECIKKFPDIVGIQKERKKLSQIKREMDKQKRTVEFDSFESEDLDFVQNAEKQFQEFPILLTKKLYHDIENTIREMRTIRSGYINSGGNISESIDSYDNLKKIMARLFTAAEERLHDNLVDPLLFCDRGTSIWLKKNNETLWKEVLENDGIFTNVMLARLQYPKYIEDHIALFRERIDDEDIQLQKVSGNQIVFTIKNQRYPSRISFVMKNSEFMRWIGCHCLTDPFFTYGKSCFGDVAIEMTKSNYNAVLNSIRSVLSKLGYDLQEEKSGNIYWLQHPREKRSQSFLYDKTVFQGALYKTAKYSDVISAYAPFLLKEEIIFVKKFDLFKRRIEAGKQWLTKGEKNRNEAIAREARGLQKQREFINY